MGIQVPMEARAIDSLGAEVTANCEPPRLDFLKWNSRTLEE